MNDDGGDGWKGPRQDAEHLYQCSYTTGGRADDNDVEPGLVAGRIESRLASGRIARHGYMGFTEADECVPARFIDKNRRDRA
jgi:hypothetical protein